MFGLSYSAAKAAIGCLIDATETGCTGASVTVRKDIVSAFNTLVSDDGTCSKNISFPHLFWTCELKFIRENCIFPILKLMMLLEYLR